MGVGEGCMSRHARATAWALALFAALAASTSQAADLLFRAARGRVQRGARRCIAAATAGHYLAHRAGAQRSRLPRCFDARPLRSDRRQALSAKPPRLGGSDGGRDLL